MKHRVLLVDDDLRVTDALRRSLHKEPYEILCASSAKDALNLLAREPMDVIVSDEKMPGISGSEFLAIASEDYPHTIRIMLTGEASLDLAISAINEGQIYRFFTKPVNAIDLIITIRQALQHKDLITESMRLLHVVKHQSALLQKLEKYSPRITEVKRGADGRIMLEEPDVDFDVLMKEIGAEMKRYKDRLPESE